MTSATPGAVLSLVGGPIGMTTALSAAGLQLNWTPSNAQAQRPAAPTLMNPVAVSAASINPTTVRVTNVAVANVNDAPTALPSSHVGARGVRGFSTDAGNGMLANAIFHYQKAVELAPNYAKAHGNLGNALLDEGRTREAIAAFETALTIRPDYQIILNNLAWVLATNPDPSLRDGPRAVVLAGEASKAADGKNPLFLRTLAAAYAEAGRFPDAVQTAQSALELPEAEGDKAQRDALRAELELYRSGSPFHESR